MAKWLGWYGPRRGHGSVEDIVSHKRQVRDELALQAGLIHARATSNLEVAPKHRTGESFVGMEGPSGGRRLDYFVYLDSGEENKVATLSIESELGIMSEAIGRSIRRGAGGRA